MWDKVQSPLKTPSWPCSCPRLLPPLLPRPYGHLALRPYPVWHLLFPERPLLPASLFSRWKPSVIPSLLGSHLVQKASPGFSGQVGISSSVFPQYFVHSTILDLLSDSISICVYTPIRLWRVCSIHFCMRSCRTQYVVCTPLLFTKYIFEVNTF